MVPATVAHHHGHLVQLHRLGVAQLIGPAQGALVNGKLELRKKPVQGRRVVITAVAKIQPGHGDLSVHVTPNVEHWPINVDLLKTKAPERTRRQRNQHLRQLQRHPVLGVEQGHIFQLKRRHHALGLGCHGAHAHPYPQGLGGPGLQLRAKFVDSRHNHPVQRPPCQTQQQPGRNHCSQ